MRTTVPVVREIRAYACDNPGCESVCETEHSTARDRCAWIEVCDQSLSVSRADVDRAASSDVLHFYWKERATRYLCSWSCLASWAFAKATAGDPLVPWNGTRQSA